MLLFSIHTRRQLCFCSLLFLFTALVGTAAADDNNKLEPTAHQNVKRMYSPASATPTTSQTQAASGGMVVYLDEQGRPTSSPARTRDAVQLPPMNQSQKGLVTQTTTLPSGIKLTTVDLQGRFQSYATGTIGPDGKVNTGCIAPGDLAPHNTGRATTGCQGTCCK